MSYHISNQWELLHRSLPRLFGFLFCVYDMFDSLLSFQASYIGIYIEILLIVVLWLIYRLKPQSRFSLLVDSTIEGTYEFFEEILGKNERRFITTFLVSIFFVVLIANLLWLVADLFSHIIVNATGEAVLPTLFQSFSSDQNATTALALIVVILSLIVQIKHMGLRKFIHEYVPFTGKWYIPSPKITNNPLSYVARAWAKIADILLSLFIWLLDIIGVIAKILSLSFRLFGNMLSWTTLLLLLTWAVVWLSQTIVGIDLPIIAPLILIAQGLLVAIVQAFVVSLLWAIFVKVAQV